MVPYRMGDLMSYNQRHHQLVLTGRYTRLVKKRSLAIKNETPILHSTATEIRDRYVVCPQKKILKIVQDLETIEL